MTQLFPDWITKRMVRRVRGFNLDAYLMALEGWRRGLKLTWHLDPSLYTDLKIIGFNPLGKSFSLQSEDRTHYFYRSRGDKVANEAVDIATNKQLTKEYLEKAGVNVPQGRTFYDDDTIDDIVKYGESLGFPLVVKPNLGSLGKGVTTNIKTTDQLRQSIEHVREIGYDEIIVEQHVCGDDYRVYVVGDEIVGVIKRSPASVIGDGEHTIKQLIKLKNKQRKENPYLRTKLINIDDELIHLVKEKNLTLNSVLDVNEHVQLKNISNLTSGGDSIESLKMLHSNIKDTAIEALRAIPGLKHAAIDLLVEDSKGKVIEINPTAGISMHMFPSQGKPVNIPEKIIDYYFPETQGLAKNLTKVYFNYRTINRELQKGYIQDIQVMDAPKKRLFAKRYVIIGKVQRVGYRKWIRNQARRRKLHGYTRNLKNGNVVVVVASDDQKEVNNFKNICKKGPRRATVKKVLEYKWNSSICIGFYVRKTR